MAADYATLGMWRMGRAFQKKCGVCGHLMKMHQVTPTRLVDAAPPGLWPQARASQAPPPQAPIVPPQRPIRDSAQPVGVADELRHMAELRKSGVLTEDEFAAQKARLLGGPSPGLKGLFKDVSALTGRLGQDARLSPTHKLSPTIRSRGRIRLPGNGRQSVVGEKYRQRELRAVTRGRRLPTVTGDNWDESVSMTAELRPEPENRHDPNAIRVEIRGKHVGYVPAEDAPNFQRPLLYLAERGKVGTCEARLMIGPTGDISVYLHLAAPEEVAFVVYAPDYCVPLTGDGIITVTGEEHHQDVLRSLASAGTAPRWETAVLNFCTIDTGKFAGQQAIEVRLGDKRVGQLTRAMTERYEEPVRDALGAGKTPICRALLSRTHDRGVQVQLMLPRADEVRGGEVDESLNGRPFR